MSKDKLQKTTVQLQLEIEELRNSLAEHKDTLNAIRNGEVDAIVVSGNNGEKVFSLTSSETPYRLLLESMSEGALTLNSDRIILYCNQRFAEMMSKTVSQLLGTDCINLISVKEQEKFQKLVETAGQGQISDNFSFNKGKNKLPLELRLSLQLLPSEITPGVSIIASDISAMKRYQEQLESLVKERTFELEAANRKLQNDLVEIEKARASLYESELKYHTTLDSIGDAVISTDLNGNITYMNPLSEELTGWTFSEAKNRPVSEIFNVIDEESRMEIENPVVKALEKGIIYVGLTNHTLLIRKDRSEITIADSAAVIKDSKGNNLGVVLVFRDMTQIRLKDDKLQESERKYRQIVETAGEGIIIASPDGRFQFVNQKFADMLGYPPEEIIGKKSDSFMYDVPQIASIVETRKNLNSGKKVKDIIRFRHKNGSVIWSLFSATPLFDLQGDYTGNLAMHTDITNQKIIENELKETQNKLNIALENGDIGTWLWNLKTDEVSIDERTERILGLQPGSFGNSFEAFKNLIHEEDITHVRNALEFSVKNKTQLENIYRLKSDNRFISSKASIINDENGTPEQMAGVCFDISGLKSSSEKSMFNLSTELMRSNKELENFAYIASHDLQEPLRMVSSYTQLLEKQYKDKLDENAHEYIRYAVDGANRMYELLNGLLAYSRINTRGKEFKKVDLNDILSSTTKNLSLLIKERNVIIESDNLPQILADESQMIILLQNLFSNSIKFSSGSPRIFVSVKSEKTQYIFSVKDKGIGIEKQYYDKIFQIFQRLHTREQYEGTGIGLAMCKRIVERHGGKIWVESEPGEGSTFFFSIPKENIVGNYEL
jgi:PAS domain S-box-containing protein